ncbi:flagellar biosynthesis anti-sigma factor FlgM [bacterium]|nr:flagellar biosynthesis anti-sigma factor FlgM [bacterium]
MDISKVQSDRILDKNIQGTGKSDRLQKQSEGTNNSGVNQTTSEKVKWSDDAKLMSQALDTIKNTPDVRAEKVAALKAKVASGSYKVDSGALADKMINDSLAEDLLTRKG